MIQTTTFLLWHYSLSPARMAETPGGYRFPSSHLTRKLVASGTSEEAIRAAQRLLDSDGFTTKVCDAP